jgi:ribosome recycling factor
MPKYSILNSETILEKLTTRLSSIRSGRVNASIFDNINVLIPAWGGEFKIVELATINILESSTCMITPFDKSILTNIEKAIRDSNLGVNPNNNGAGLKIVFPPMTEENRKARVKELKQYEEDSKIEVRNTRQNLLKAQKTKKETAEISEDDLKRFESNLQKEVDTLNKDIEQIISDKSAEIMKL